MTSLMIAAALLAQAPTGIWKLESATVEGRPVAAADGFLEHFGGVKPGMEWRLRRNGDATFNRVPVHYDYLEETRELDVESTDGKEEVGQMFDVKFTDKVMRLSFEEKGRTVEMVFKKG